MFHRRHSSSSDAGMGLIIVGVLALVLWAGTRLYKAEVSYKQDVGGHLKRAADANTVEIARQELKTALDNMERRGMTEGYTSIIWRTPDEDVAFWYNNIKAAKAELDSLPPQSTPLERTNVLMKLRETLTDNGESGTVITEPAGISIFPHNKVYFWIWFGGSCVLIVIGFFKLDHY